MSEVALKEVLDSYSLSSHAIALLEDMGEHVHFSKEAFVAKMGQHNSKEYIVLNGICRTCLFSEEGEDTTIGFFVPGMVLSPFVIRTKDQVSHLNIQASTSLELLAFDAVVFEQLMVDNLEIRAFGNEVLKRELARMFQKEIGMASSSAKERLLAFRKAYPMLENRVPHAEIASYLGITTVSLSRLRGELTD